MQKILQTCFLALLCLAGSPSSAQSKVAESPPEVPLHRSGLHVSTHSGDTYRGGETLSDTFLRYNDGPELSILPLHSGGPWTMDRGPNLPSPVSRLLSPNDKQNILGTSDTESLDSCILCLKSSNSLVDQHLDSGAGEEATSLQPAPVTVFAQFLEDLETIQKTSDTESLGSCVACAEHLTDESREVRSMGLDSSLPVLIYGELINPDSLGVLKLSYNEVFLSQGLTLRDSTIEPELTRGTFYDGVLDPRVQKFQARIPVNQGPVMLNLTIGQRSLLKDYLVFPGDSIKIGMDLQDFVIVFSGPQAKWFEAQYAVKRAQSTDKFGDSRVVLEDDREYLLDQSDNRALMEAQDTVFGSRIAIYEFGRDGLDWEQKILLDTVRANIPGWFALLSFRGEIAQERFGLLESQLLGAFYASHLSTFRRYHHGMPLALGDTTAALRSKAAMPEILNKLDSVLSEILAKGLTPGAMDLAREWSATERVLTGETLEASISAKYQSPVRERLLLSVLRKRLSLGGIPKEEWETFATHLEESTVASGFEALQSTFRPGTVLAPAKLYSLDGEEVSLREFQGRPALLYFYFSGCTHSGNYFRNYLWPFYLESGRDMDLQLIAISVDRDSGLWKAELPNYSNTEITNLNLPEDSSQAWLERYLFTGYPRAMLLDEAGKVLSHSLGGKDYQEYKSRILFLLESHQPIVHSPIP